MVAVRLPTMLPTQIGTRLGLDSAAGGSGGLSLSGTLTPEIEGDAIVGESLFATNGEWSDAPDSYSYQWKRNGSAISGANSQSYTLVLSDNGNQITCEVTAAKSGYASATQSTPYIVCSTETEPTFTLFGTMSSSGGGVYNGNAFTDGNGVSTTTLVGDGWVEFEHRTGDQGLLALSTTGGSQSFTSSLIFVNVRADGDWGWAVNGGAVTDSNVTVGNGDKMRIRRRNAFFYIELDTGSGWSSLAGAEIPDTVNNQTLYFHIMATGDIYAPKIAQYTREAEFGDLKSVFDGNSLTFGDTVSVQSPYPKGVISYLRQRSSSVAGYAAGVNGQATLEMIADYGTEIDPQYDGAKTNILVAWEDINSILNDGRTANQNYADMQTYFGLAVSTGYEHRILVGGFYPRTPYNNAAWNTGSPTPLSRQEDYFDQVAGSSGEDWTDVVDLRENPDVGGISGQAQDSGFFNDSVHMNMRGYQTIAESISYAVRKSLLT